MYRVAHCVEGSMGYVSGWSLTEFLLRVKAQIRWVVDRSFDILYKSSWSVCAVVPKRKGAQVMHTNSLLKLGSTSIPVPKAASAFYYMLIKCQRAIT